MSQFLGHGDDGVSRPIELVDGVQLEGSHTERFRDLRVDVRSLEAHDEA